MNVGNRLAYGVVSVAKEENGGLFVQEVVSPEERGKGRTEGVNRALALNFTAHGEIKIKVEREGGGVELCVGVGVGWLCWVSGLGKAGVGR